jgi:hypothetical protein
MDLMVLRGSGGQMRQIWLEMVPILYPFGGLEPFADRNRNGYPDLIVTGGTGGNCYWQEFQLLEFRPGDVVVDLIPPDDDIYVRTMVDLNNDGVQELELRIYTYVPYQSTACSSIRLVRYYGWDGSAYVDISPTLNQSYWPAINQFWANLPDDAVCLQPTEPDLIPMLLGYEAMGRFEEGWTRLQSRLRWDACASFTPMTSFQLDNMAQLLFWVGERLE